MQYTTKLLRQFRLTIGRNIQRERMRRGMRLHRLARLSGVPEWRIDQYELGKGEIRLDDLVRIACGLNQPPESLFYAPASSAAGETAVPVRG